MSQLLIYLVIIVLSSLVVWKGGNLLETTAARLGEYYQLSPIVQGGVVTAIGSSFPELATTVISTLLHGEFDLGVAAIIGSAIFNILVIPGLSAVVANGIPSTWSFVVKDVQFYITSIIALLLIFSLAVIYHPVSDDPLRGNVTRSLALLPIALYILYLVLQRKENQGYQDGKDEQPDTDWKPGLTWLKLLGSLLLIVASVEGLVRGAIFLGDYFDTPSFLWGALVVAAATSIPDAIVSVQSARHGRGITSLANVVGSNIFDLLIAVPVGVLLAGSAVVNFTLATWLMLVLGICTIVLILLLLRHDRLSRWEGAFLLLLYLGFVIALIGYAL